MRDVVFDVKQPPLPMEIFTVLILSHIHQLPFSLSDVSSDVSLEVIVTGDKMKCTMKCFLKIFSLGLNIVGNIWDFIMQ